jgi:predicted phosphodiesterase
VKSLILSDLHANQYALNAVLADAEGDFEQIVCCGDLVGYNPHPTPVVDWTRNHCAHVIRGNHDKAVAGIEDLESFNDIARVAALWTSREMSEVELAYLRDLPHGPVHIDGFELWHGSVRDEDEYITSKAIAAPSFPLMDSPVGFFGHTHLQGGYFRRRGNVGVIPGVRRKEHESVIELEPDSLYMINPGSVGQPRDGDPRAAYGIYDSGARTVTLRRVDYPIRKTAEDILAAGLPPLLAARLELGY